MAEKRKMKPKTIVLDYDDTVVDFTGGLCELHNKRHNTCITQNDMKEWDFKNLNVKDATGKVTTGVELYKTFKDYEPFGIYVGLDLLRDSYNALECMRDKGYKIIILTARSEAFGKQTELDLVRNKLYKFVDEVILKPDTFDDIENFKVKKLKELSKTHNIQVFADDRAETIKEVQENCSKINKIFLIEKGYNRDFYEEGVVKIKDLMEIIRYLKKVK